MAIPLNDLLMGALTELRVHPSAKWIRASSSGETLVSSTRAVIVWEPRRLVSSYAVPATENRTVCAYKGDAHSTGLSRCLVESFAILPGPTRGR